MKLSLTFILSLFYAFSFASPVHLRSRGRRIPLSKRISFRKQGHVDVDELQAHLLYSTSKITEGFRTYQQNTGKPHPLSGTKVHSKRSTSPIPLSNDANTLWHGNITVGTPPQTFMVDFDTGSSDLFLPSPDCDSTCEGHSSYDASQSSTATNLTMPFSLRYGDGSRVAGQQYMDTVNVAGLTAQNQTFGAASSYSSGFEKESFPPDGLVGMAFSELSDFNANPLFQTLLDQNQPDEAMFGFKLTHDDSEMFLGGVNKALFTGDLTFVNVTHKAYWQVDVDGISVNDTRVISGISGIIDTGTTLLVGDDSSVEKLYASVPGSKPADEAILGSGFYTFPCDTIPDISLTFNGKSFHVQPDIFNIGPVSDNSTECVGGVVSSGTSKPFWIIGDVFLRNVYTAFDVGNTRVGFADLA